MARFIRLEGRTDYARAHLLQRALLEARARGEIPDVVLLLEHAEVITVGRTRGADANVLAAGDVPVVRVERGGDVTWHGPGQLVAYPIVRLEGRRADLHLHLRSLEGAVLDLLADLGLKPTRDERNTGVWLPDPPGLPRKVCSVGIACRRWVTWHGLALNVCPDLASFTAIRPCGFEADVMTRLCDHLWRDHPTVSSLAPPLAVHLSRHLEVPLDGLDAADGPDEVARMLGIGEISG